MAELLRVATAGSVDDGKSTLIGRLLYDSKNVYADQLAAVADASRRRGLAATDLALLTDGLRAERDQGITIDVAYRYFATPRRTFILADTPGHVQYTRNMVTGASTADLAIILVDARHGLTEQTRRHAAITALLRVQHVVLAINKMDLVSFSEEIYDSVVADFDVLANKLGLAATTAIPISALHGDNVVDPSPHMPWYAGPALLAHLENVSAVAPPEGIGARIPIQLVLRPRSKEHPDYRAYAGRVAAGSLRPGDEVVALPSGQRSRVTEIDTADGPLAVASLGRSVAVRLSPAIDVSRGDLLASIENPPQVTQKLSGQVCVLSDCVLGVGDRLRVRVGTREVRAIVHAIDDRLDVTSLTRHETTMLQVNDIGSLTLTLAEPVPVDPYAVSRTTGSFLLVDDVSGATLAAGMAT